MNRVLVTGATGFVGRQAVEELCKRGYEVHAVSRKAENSPQEKMTFHSCDLFSSEAVEKVMAEVRPTHLLHFAWYVEPGKFWDAEENYFWVTASTHLFRCFIKRGGKRAVFAGTCAEYDWSHTCFSENSTPMKPRTRYGACKNKLHAVLQTLAGKSGVKLAWGRLFFLYGPYEARKRLVPEVINGLLDAQPVPCTDGQEERDFMHVADAARAFVEIMESDFEGPINVATGKTVTLERVASFIAQKIGKPELLRFGEHPSPPDNPHRLAADTHVLNTMVGFQSKYSLEQGLEETIQWWKAQRPL